MRRAGVAPGLVALVLLTMGLLAALVWAAHAAGYRVNMTISHPLGLYRIVDRAPQVGLYALFCAPLPRTALPPLDEIRPPCTADSDGYQILKRIVRIAPGPRYVVQGDHPRALDSRLFGPLDAGDIEAVAVRVWVFGGGYRAAEECYSLSW